ncbi:phage tail protein [Glaciimonas sp. GNP009]
MLKPTSLQNHLIAANPDLRQNPDKLLVFADEGNVVATGSASLSFEYRYKLNIILTDYSGDPDAIIVPLLAWIALHQRDLLNNPTLRQTGIGFDVDFNNHETIDLSIKLDLTERVIVKREGGRLAIRHTPEAQPTPDYSDDFWTLYQGESLLAEWHTPVQLA